MKTCELLPGSQKGMPAIKISVEFSGGYVSAIGGCEKHGRADEESLIAQVQGCIINGYDT